MSVCRRWAQTSLVEVVEGTGDLSRVEPGVLLRQATMSLHVEHEVTTIDTLDHKEQPAERECVCVGVCGCGMAEVSPALSLEAGVQAHKERVIGRLFKHMLLSLNPVNVLRRCT